VAGRSAGRECPEQRPVADRAHRHCPLRLSTELEALVFDHPPRDAGDLPVSDAPPRWIKPQLAALVKKAPEGDGWLHEMKLDGYRMHARLEAGEVRILTRRGHDWIDKYPAIVRAVAGLPARNAMASFAGCCPMAGRPSILSRTQATSVPDPLSSSCSISCSSTEKISTPCR
jgi:hypothetical protein